MMLLAFGIEWLGLAWWWLGTVLHALRLKPRQIDSYDTKFSFRNSDKCCYMRYPYDIIVLLYIVLP